MKRKILSILSVFFLLWQFPCCVLAAEESMVTIRSGYWADNVLYTFAHFPQEAPEKLEVSLFVNNYQQAQTATPESFLQTRATMHYLLLIDASAPVKQYKYRISAFVQSLMEDGSNLDVSIATMGNSFHVVATNLTSLDAVRAALDRVTFLHDDSDICGGTVKALQYLGKKSLRAGDVSSLVVITDGQPWYSTTEPKRKAQATKDAAAMMEAYPEIIVSTLCFRNWEKKTFSVLSSGKGLHLSADSLANARKSGKAFADYLESLYTVTFPLNGYADIPMITDSVQLSVESSWFSIGRIRNVDTEPVLDSKDTIELPPLDEPEEKETQGTESTEPTEAIGTTEPTDQTAQTTIPDEETMAVVATDTEDTATFDTMDPGEAEKNSISPLIIGAGKAAVAVVVAVLLIVGILAKKKKSKEFSVRVRVEILFGEAVRKKEIYQLTNELLIGTGKQCDIVIRDPDAAEVNTRIFKQGQMIYIEDMGSPQGTVLNGMRLFSSNRLRSEDEIAIGNTVLRVLF